MFAWVRRLFRDSEPAPEEADDYAVAVVVPPEAREMIYSREAPRDEPAPEPPLIGSVEHRLAQARPRW